MIGGTVEQSDDTDTVGAQVYDEFSGYAATPLLLI